MISGQLGLFRHDEPAFDAGFSRLRRFELAGGAWVEYVPEWLSGHERVFEALARGMGWRTMVEHIHEKQITAPRLSAVVPDDGAGHPVLESIRHAVSDRYREQFERISMAFYRHGTDSVAWHGDRVARRMPEALVATVSVGARRKFLLRPRGGGRSIAFELGWGDLLVMGGSCQRTWQHSVPKRSHAEPRIAIMYRPRWAELYSSGQEQQS